MDATEFIRKWSRSTGSERAESQPHFLDLCALVEHGTPADLDPKHEWFTFEKGATKQSGGEGFADVWKKGFFAWEYKGKHKDLDAAYDQLLQYREALENPPLLLVCDIDRIIVHTNFNNTPTQVHTVRLLEMDQPRNLEILRAVFYDPDNLKPQRTRQEVTTDAAERIAEIAQSMRERGLDPQEVAKFLDRIVFCLFAEDIALLPGHLFSHLVETSQGQPEAFRRKVAQLFDAMANGGDFGPDTILHFNGNLFADSPVLEMTEAELDRVYYASKLEWDAVDPSIFGTLFERGMDPGKRAQIGAHYTSREDIETLVEPVVMWPLRREWDEVRQTVENLLTTGRKAAGPAGAGTPPKKALTPAQHAKAVDESDRLVRRFHERLTQLKVLDPACGSGNFLYVTLQKLKDLEKAVIVFAQQNGLGGVPAAVAPHQLLGIEVNAYAYELAQMVVWIGYIQWMRANGFEIGRDPVLSPMAGNFQCKDAILDLSDPANPKEPDWPKVDCIVGNPPFLGGQKILDSLGGEYAAALRELYEGKVPGGADLCCYWVEKARVQVEQERCGRAGLLATQGIRGGSNRNVLERLASTAPIFFAESDRPWVLEGANVHVSMIGFSREAPRQVVLNGQIVPKVNANLTASVDITIALPQAASKRLAFQGPVRVGPFNMAVDQAKHLLLQPNPVPRPNSDVLRPSLNGGDVTARGRDEWVIDYGDMAFEDACLYVDPFRLVEEKVKPLRVKARDGSRREFWWRHGRSGQALRSALAPLARYIVMAQTAKYTLFAWRDTVVSPEQTVIAFARSDDYFFGVLHSKLHEVWALRLGTRLETRPRYTPTTCFETFPFPWPPGQEPQNDPLVKAIADAAQELNELRENWLNPTEWTTTEVLEFPGSTAGPWARYVQKANDQGIGTVRYPRIVDNGTMPSQLKRRTLTNLYNQRPAWLDNAHRKLDKAVCAAYASTTGPAGATGDTAWRPDMSDEQILEKLLALNLERAKAQH